MKKKKKAIGKRQRQIKGKREKGGRELAEKEKAEGKEKR